MSTEFAPSLLLAQAQRLNGFSRLGDFFMNAQSGSRKLWSRSKILTLDSQEIAKGAIRLEIAPAEGTFLPDDPTPPTLDTLKELTLVAELEINRFELSNWHRCLAQVEVDGLGNCHVGPHYHFVCES